MGWYFCLVVFINGLVFLFGGIYKWVGKNTSIYIVNSLSALICRNNIKRLRPEQGDDNRQSKTWNRRR